MSEVISEVNIHIYVRLLRVRLLYQKIKRSIKSVSLKFFLPVVLQLSPSII